MKFDPHTDIKKCNDPAFLEKLLDVFIPMDKKNLADGVNKEIIESSGQNYEEYSTKVLAGIFKIEKIAKERLEFLKKK